MRRKRIVRQIVWGVLAGVLAGGFFPSPGKAESAEPKSPVLTMEELEVRGIREKPGQLYVSVPDQIFTPAPVRYDLLAEDLSKPILPWEIREDYSGRERQDHREGK